MVKHTVEDCRLSMGTRKTTAEEIRLRYHYRSLVLRGKADISFETARRLIGPDCVYRLYSTVDLKKRQGKRRGPRKG